MPKITLEEANKMIEKRERAERAESKFMRRQSHNAKIGAEKAARKRNKVIREREESLKRKQLHERNDQIEKAFQALIDAGKAVKRWTPDIKALERKAKQAKEKVKEMMVKRTRATRHLFYKKN